MDQDSSHRYKRRLTDSPIGQNSSLRKGGNLSDSSNDQRISHRIGKRLRPAESPANLQERIQFTQEERKRRQVRLMKDCGIDIISKICISCGCV